MRQSILVAAGLIGCALWTAPAPAAEPTNEARVDGYVLGYDYLEPLPTAVPPGPDLPPVANTFVTELTQWAEEIGLPLQLQLDGYRRGQQAQPAPAGERYGSLVRYGSSAVELAGYDASYYELTLCGLSAAELDAIKQRLQALPGVSPPVQREYSGKYNYLGPHWRELLGCTVTLNGSAYDYPGDFSDLDARALRWQYDSLNPGDVLFIAFREKDPESVTPKRMEQLGDVFKVELLEHGLELTTVLEVWNEGRALLASSDAWRSNTNNGWRIELPHDAPIAGVDPLAALISRYDVRLHLTEQELNPIHTQFVYTLFDAGRFVVAGADKPRAEELEAIQALATAAEAALQAFRATHPECWNERLYEWRARSFMTRRFGGVPLELHVNVQDADGATARALREYLAQAVPGLPQPQETVTNVLEQRRQNELNPPNPYAHDEIKFPPLPPPNPDEWCAYSGQRLDFKVFGWNADEAGRYGNSPQLTEVLAAIAAWATRQGLTLNPRPDAPRGLAGLAQPSTQPRVFVGDANMSGGSGRFMKHLCSVYLSGPDATLAQSLSAELAAMPGVSLPELTACTFYFHAGHPSEPLEGCDLVIDGKRYSFPGDFCWEEANSIEHLAPPAGSVYYKAFGTLAFQKDSHIPLPEVARIARADDGSIAITTYMAEWPEGRALYNPPPNIGGGVTVHIPDETQVTDAEIMARLESQTRNSYKFYEAKESGRYFFTLFYTLATPQRWEALAQTPAQPGEDAPAQLLWQQLDAKLKQWLAEHPQYVAVDGASNHVDWFGNEDGGLTLGVQVTTRSDDDALCNELAALLRDIPGLPEPERRQDPNWRYDASAD